LTKQAPSQKLNMSEVPDWIAGKGKIRHKEP
jgi:hypothetical protein